MVRVCRRGGRVVISDLVVAPGVDRDRFDHLHRLLDPSHVRVFLEEELVEILPPGVALTHGETTTLRFPIDVAVTDQSDRAAVIVALRDELAGGHLTGFDPAEDNGTFVVSFINCVVHGTIE